MRIEYQLLNFALLVLLLWFFGRKAIGAMFSKRRQGIEKDLEAMEAGHAKGLQLEGQLDEAKQEGALQLTQVQQEGEQRLQQQLQEQDEAARAEAALQEQKLQESLERARVSMLRRVKRSVVGMVGEVAPEHLHLSPRFGQQRLEEILPALHPSPADQMYLEADVPLPIELRTAEPLSDTDLDRLSEAVRRAYPRSRWPQGSFIPQVVDVSLLGGLKLKVHDTVYDGSLQTILNTVASGELVATPDAQHGLPELRQAVEKLIDTLNPNISVYQVGQVVSVSDGICMVSGLSDALYGELLLFPGDIRGMVLNLDKYLVGCAMFGEFEHIDEGDQVRRTGHVIEVPVGEELLGRVLNGLGNPIDGMGDMPYSQVRPVECPAPAIIERQAVKVPLYTGIKAVDALVPIGRGQRELIIGDRQTGKTALGVDAIINQRGKDVLCIYVAIGQKETTVASVAQVLRNHDAMGYTTIVAADAYHAAPMQYIAPYTATAMAEYFMRKGRDVLIVYDDLSKHAVAYRELSLLLHRPSGREAYPGDVFYLHSRLLERSARLTKEAGGGSITALPIIETQEGDISAYIPTNVISITDGQIFLESDLFNEGQRPAVNVGLSVSRVGGSAQTGPMRQVSGRLRMELAQYRELASFSQFGSDLDAGTKASLARGDRMVAALRQGQYQPVPLNHQVLLLQAVTQGFADDVEPKDIPAFEERLVRDFSHRWPQWMARLSGEEKLSKEELAQLTRALQETKEAMA